MAPFGIRSSLVTDPAAEQTPSSPLSDAVAEKTDEGIDRLHEVLTLVRSQTGSLREIQKHATDIQGAVSTIDGFGTELKKIEALLGQAVSEARQALGVKHGVGKLATGMSDMKNIVTHQQDGLAAIKTKLDNIMPANASSHCLVLPAVAAVECARGRRKRGADFL